MQGVTIMEKQQEYKVPPGEEGLDVMTYFRGFTIKIFWYGWIIFYFLDSYHVKTLTLQYASDERGRLFGTKHRHVVVRGASSELFHY